MNKEGKSPHDNVYTRLGRSQHHGIGVLAILDIPKGTNVFGDDESEIVWVNKSEIQGLDNEIKRLYEDFCILRNDKYGCPTNFNMLTVGWYLNESKSDFNVGCDKNYNFIAIRDIKRGEELLVDYSTYSDEIK